VHISTHVGLPNQHRKGHYPPTVPSVLRRSSKATRTTLWKRAAGAVTTSTRTAASGGQRVRKRAKPVLCVAVPGLRQVLAKPLALVALLLW